MSLTDDQRIAQITINSDPTNSGTSKDHTFQLAYGPGEQGLTYSPASRTGYVVEGGGAALQTVISNLLGDGEVNAGMFVDLGTGQWTHEFDFSSWAGAQGPDGTPLQWGDGSSDPQDPSDVTATDATGCDPITQMQILAYIVNNSLIGSLPEEAPGAGAIADGPAKLEVGQHHPDGALDPLDVVLEGPTTEYVSSDGAFTGSLTCIVAADLGEAWDAQSRTEK